MASGISLPFARSPRCSDGRPNASPVWCVGSVRRLLFAERRVELSELPWTSRLKVSRQSRVRPTAIRVGLGAQALSVCARERHPVRPEPEPLDAPFLVCIQTLNTVPRFCICLEPSAYRVRVARERPTHTQYSAPHTHSHSARGRAPRGFSGGFCVLLRALHFDTGMNNLTEKRHACTPRQGDKGWTSGSCVTVCVSCYSI